MSRWRALTPLVSDWLTGGEEGGARRAVGVGGRSARGRRQDQGSNRLSCPVRTHTLGAHRPLLEGAGVVGLALPCAVVFTFIIQAVFYLNVSVHIFG